MARDIDAEIERLSEQRQAAWADGGRAQEAKRLGERLAVLYEEKRITSAESGTPAQRARAIKRAVAERELDRLMSTA